MIKKLIQSLMAKRLNDLEKIIAITIFHNAVRNSVMDSPYVLLNNFKNGKLIWNYEKNHFVNKAIITGKKINYIDKKLDELNETIKKQNISIHSIYKYFNNGFEMQKIKNLYYITKMNDCIVFKVKSNAYKQLIGDKI